jgi:YD repeat-containing protein
VLSTTEAGQTVSRTYDQRGQVASYTTSTGQTFTYQKDANGNLTLLTLPDGKTLSYTWDNRDRLTAITDWAGRVSSITWDAASRMTQITRPNGTLMGRGMLYDAAHDAALLKYQVSRFSIYHPQVIQANPDFFNDRWFNFWGVGR